MNLPRGMTIAWQASTQHDISRVASLSLGGLFIEADRPGSDRRHASSAIRYSRRTVPPKPWFVVHLKGKGMGVEFTELPAALEPDWIACCKNCSATFALQSSDAILAGGLPRRHGHWICSPGFPSVLIDSASFGSSSPTLTICHR